MVLAQIAEVHFESAEWEAITKTEATKEEFLAEDSNIGVFVALFRPSLSNKCS